MVNTNTATGAFRGAPQKVVPFEVSVPSSLSASDDGRTLAAVIEKIQPDIFIGLLSLPGPTLGATRRLSGNLRSDYPHGWDVNSHSVYFESNRENGVFHVFRESLDSPNAEILTSGDKEQFFPTPTADGGHVLYEEWKNRNKERSIYQINRDGGGPKLVWNLKELDEWRCPLSNSSFCVLREVEGHEQFVFYVLDLEKGKGWELARTAWIPTVLGDWALSPDGKVAAIPNHDPQSPSIRLVRLDGPALEREIKVKQTSQLWGISWAVDLSGFYAESRTGNVHHLDFISVSGDVHKLRDTRGNTWGVPSPDGRKLAFVDSSVNPNVVTWQSAIR